VLPTVDVFEYASYPCQSALPSRCILWYASLLSPHPSLQVYSSMHPSHHHALPSRCRLRYACLGPPITVPFPLDAYSGMHTPNRYFFPALSASVRPFLTMHTWACMLFPVLSDPSLPMHTQACMLCSLCYLIPPSRCIFRHACPLFCVTWSLPPDGYILGHACSLSFPPDVCSGMHASVCSLSLLIYPSLSCVLKYACVFSTVSPSTIIH
jgi:hypothetical protein